MISSWRIRMGSRGSKSGDKRDGKSRPAAFDVSEIVIPGGFRCPISLDLMKDPVILCTGITYDRQSIETWLEAGNFTCPVTKQPLQSADLVPNHALRRVIQSWCVENRSKGIERIPTPRIPASRAQVSEILSQVESASRRGSPKAFVDAVDRIRLLAKESERNRRCAAGAGSGAALTAALAAFCERFEDAESDTEPAAAVEATLAATTAVAPLDSVACSRVWSRPCMRRLAGVLLEGSPEGRRNAALLLREVLEDEEKVLIGDNRKMLEATPELVEGLVRMVQEPICPAATKASLTAIFRMVCASDWIRSRAVDAGMVSVLLETLAGCERGLCEKALAVLDQACLAREGREQVYGHALAVPVLVKKVFRVSDMATELAVSVLWRLCKGANDEAVAVEALSVGAFQKLLLLLQVGCGERTKERATELLKMMNSYRDRCECIDSGDFKDVKRPA